MELVNLTPHDLNFYSNNVCILTIPSSGVCRVSSKRVLSSEVNFNGVNIPIHSMEYGIIENLPSPKPNTIYAVSLLVKQLCRDRVDVLCVDTSPEGVIRGNNGQIIGTTGLTF
jgi:hypothetical protein